MTPLSPRRLVCLVVGCLLLANVAVAAESAKPVFLYSRYFNAKGEGRYLATGQYRDVVERLAGDFQVRVNDLPLNAETLKGVAVVLISNPSDKPVGKNPPPHHVSPQDVSELTHFIRDGGGLIVMGNQENHNLEINDFNKLLGEFGMRFENHYTDAKQLIIPKDVAIIGGLRWAFYTGNQVVIDPDNSSRARALVLNDLRQPPLGGKRDEKGTLLAIAEPGKGHVVVVTDAGWIKRQLIRCDARGQVIHVLAVGQQMLLIEPLRHVQNSPLLCQILASGWIEVQHRRAGIAKDRRLVRARQKAATIHRRPAFHVSGGLHHHKGREILRFTAQAIGDPRPHRRSAHSSRASVHQVLGRRVIEGLVMARADHRQIVGALLEIGVRVGDLKPRLSAPAECLRGAQHPRVNVGELKRETFDQAWRQRLAVQFVQLGLRIKRINLRWPPLHKEEDHVLGTRRAMRWTSRQRVCPPCRRRRCCPGTLSAKQVQQRP